MAPYPNSALADLPQRYQHADILSWLQDTGSTTKRLRKEVPNLKFQLLATGPILAHPREANMAGINAGTACWGRQILFTSDSQGFLFSSVVIPPQTCAASGDTLTKLGAQPLGDVLFCKNNHHRTHCGISLLHHPDPLLQAAERYIVDSLDHALTRHSICHYQGLPLLIHDIFLPRLIDFILC